MDKRVVLRLAGEQDNDSFGRVKMIRSSGDEGIVPTNREDVLNLWKADGGRRVQAISDLSRRPRETVTANFITTGTQRTEQQGNGYAVLSRDKGRAMFESVQLALAEAFLTQKAHKVVAMCNEYNEGSAQVLEKAGMKREGIFRKELPWQGRWVDQWFYCLLAEEYERMQKSWESRRSASDV